MGRRRVLVLDDEQGVRHALARVFRRFDVTSCATIGEARAMLLGHAFDAVISDVQLGDGCGVTLFDEIARVRPELATRYLFLSGAADVPDVKSRLDRTGAPYFKKPFVVRTLLDRVETIVTSVQSPPKGVSDV